MEMNEYQNLASRTAQFETDKFNPLIYTVLGLAGETGEVVEKVKKILRNDDAEVSEEKREELKKELGDVLWYLSQCSRVLGFDLEDVAQANINKLADRKERGVIASEGDNR